MSYKTAWSHEIIVLECKYNFGLVSMRSHPRIITNSEMQSADASNRHSAAEIRRFLDNHRSGKRVNSIENADNKLVRYIFNCTSEPMDSGPR